MVVVGAREQLLPLFFKLSTRITTEGMVGTECRGENYLAQKVGQGYVVFRGDESSVSLPLLEITKTEAEAERAMQSHAYNLAIKIGIPPQNILQEGEADYSI